MTDSKLEHQRTPQYRKAAAKITLCTKGLKKKSNNS